MTDKNQQKKHDKPVHKEKTAHEHKPHPTPVDEANEWKEKYLRAYAEMENIKKRTQAELVSRSKVAIGDFAVDLLPVADNFGRALAMPIPDDMKDNAFLKNFIQGMQLTQKTLKDALAKNGVTEIQSMGRHFNPDFEQVIQTVADPSKPDGEVVQVWQPGYLINGDRVLREAMVVVSKKDA